MVGRPKKDSSNLDVARIVEAAWTLVDREGLAALSTRSLAAELNVKGPALYWHVRSKQQLMSLMVEHVLRDSIGAQPAGLAWPDWLRQLGREQRRLLLSRRDAGMVAASAPPTERIRTELVPQIMEPLLQAGFSREQATAGAGSLAAFVLGWVIYEQRTETRDFMVSLADPDAAFAYGLDAFVDGLVTRAKAAGIDAGEGLDVAADNNNRYGLTRRAR